MEWEARTKKEFPNTQYFFHVAGEQVGSWTTTWNATLRRAGLRVPVLDSKGVQKVSKKNKLWKNLVSFHDSRRTNVTNLDIMGLDEKDIMRVTGHKTTTMSRRYNQSDEAAERVRLAQNNSLGVVVASPVPLPVPSSSWKDQLKDLKEMLDAGLLPEDLYKQEVAKVMASRT